MINTLTITAEEYSEFVVCRLYEGNRLLYITRSSNGILGLSAPFQVMLRADRTELNFCDDLQEAKSFIRAVTKAEVPEYKAVPYKRMKAVYTPTGRINSSRPNAPNIPKAIIEKPKLTPQEQLQVDVWVEHGHDREQSERAVLALRNLSPEQRTVALGGASGGGNSRV